jgi:response regulator RpfG family c-di-GMP phosphodiesterase
MNGSKRVLVAAQPLAWRVLEQMLGDVAELVVTHTTADAFKILERERIDLIVSTIAFDDSQMIEFLQAVKGSNSTAHIPFLCSRVLGGVLRDSMVSRMREVCKECGAVDLLDVARLPPDRAQAVLREAVVGNFPPKTA